MKKQSQKMEPRPMARIELEWNRDIPDDRLGQMKKEEQGCQNCRTCKSYDNCDSAIGK